jgi:hypothetical protein
MSTHSTLFTFPGLCAFILMCVCLLILANAIAGMA